MVILHLHMILTCWSTLFIISARSTIISSKISFEGVSSSKIASSSVISSIYNTCIISALLDTFEVYLKILSQWGGLDMLVVMHFMGINILWKIITSIGVLGCRPDMRKNGLNFVEPCFCVRIENAISFKKSSQLS